MAINGSGSIYRVTSSGDTETTVATTEKLEFNTGAIVPDTTGRNTATGFNSTRDLNFHPNPRRAIDIIQDGKLGRKLVRLTGYFKDHNATLGPTNLDKWQNEDAANDDFPFGRFGLRLPDFANGILTLLPTATKGYMLWDFDIEDVERPRDEVQFILKVYRNGAV